MSIENTENPQDPGEDATNEEPAGIPAAPPPATTPTPSTPIGVEPFDVPAPETVEIPDAAKAIDGFEVPPPPTFGATPPPSPEPVIPPAPAPDVPTPRRREVWSSDSTWSSASAHKRESVPATAAQAAAHQAVEAREDAAEQDFVYPAPGDAAENSYRGWTITIFAGLAVLLIGAIIWIAYLLTNAPLNLAGADEDPIRQPAPIVSVSSEPVGSAPGDSAPVSSGECGDLCEEVATLVGNEVTGADGADTWRLSGAWETADSAVVTAVETVHAEYESAAGSLVFTIWGFDDDATADDAYAAFIDAQDEPDHTDSVYEDGTGVRTDFSDGSTSSVLWSVTGDETQPWVLQVEGSDGDAVTQFYLALPI